jgi:hypothetical protein
MILYIMTGRIEGLPILCRCGILCSPGYFLARSISVSRSLLNDFRATALPGFLGLGRWMLRNWSHRLWNMTYTREILRRADCSLVGQ